MAPAERSGSTSRPVHALDPVLRPRGVAVVGASSDATKRGHQVVRALVESSYAGGVFPVNPRGGELFGLRVWPGVEAIEGEVDLALVCTPAESVPEVLAECGRAGIRGAVILAVGFGERGEAGRTLEARVLEAARGAGGGAGIRVVGPNTSGLLNLGIDLNLIGMGGLRRGPLALLVQSGNTALSLLTRAAERGGGVSVCVGVGNEADIRFDEYLDWLEGDADTRAILMYVDGFRDGRRFLATARRVSRTKPIVLLKGGRSDAGRAAARSHTGALAGEYATMRAGLRQAGVIEATRSDELLAIGEALAGQPPMAGGRAGAGAGVAVLADGGGQAVIAADTLTEHDVPLARLAPETQERLGALLGPSAEVANPVDVAGAGDRRPSVFARALELLVADPGVGGVLMIGLFGGYAIRFASSLEAEEREAASGLVQGAGRAGKPLVVHSIYAESGSGPIGALRGAGVPVIESVEVACAAMAAASRRGRSLAPSTREWPAGIRPTGAAGRTAGGAREGAVPPPVAAARREGRGTLLETETRALLAGFGVPLVPAELCETADAVRDAAARFGGAVALKVVSPTVSHKTEAGGVVLNVTGPDAAAEAFAGIRRSVEAHLGRAGEAAGPADIRGVLVSPMLPRPVAELLVGVRRDPGFGPVLTFGAGGVLTELLRDTALRILPIGRADAVAMQAETRVAALLRGFRGGAVVDPEAVADVLLAVARCALDHEDVAELEINPLFAYGDRLVAVDARAYLTAE